MRQRGAGSRAAGTSAAGASSPAPARQLAPGWPARGHRAPVQPASTRAPAGTSTAARARRHQCGRAGTSATGTGAASTIAPCTIAVSRHQCSRAGTSASATSAARSARDAVSSACALIAELWLGLRRSGRACHGTCAARPALWAGQWQPE
eukprot:15036617-Alexandrium_andersonii.AAC.1